MGLLCDADSDCLGIMTQSNSYYAWAARKNVTPVTSCYFCPKSLNKWSRADGSQAVYWKTLAPIPTPAPSSAPTTAFPPAPSAAPTPAPSAVQVIYDEKQERNCIQPSMDHAPLDKGSVILPQCKLLCDADSDCSDIMTQSNSYYAWAARKNVTPVTSCYFCPKSLDISYNRGADQSWEISHTLFLLDDETSSSYTLSCNVLVCDMSQGSACTLAVDCLLS